MNSLSWFIYLIHVADTVRDTALFFIFLPIIAIIGTAATIGIHNDTTFKDNDLWEWTTWNKWVKRWAFVVIPIGVAIYVVLPSRQTMLLIAGSEIGERIVQSEGVRSITDPSITLLRTWIETETARLLEESTGRKK